jgi:hypothetical protein
MAHATNGLAGTILTTNERRIMAGPVELLIVAAGFGIVGVYLFIVSRFLREAEAETKRVEGAEEAAAH